MGNRAGVARTKERLDLDRVAGYPAVRGGRRADPSGARLARLVTVGICDHCGDSINLGCGCENKAGNRSSPVGWLMTQKRSSLRGERCAGATCIRSASPAMSVGAVVKVVAGNGVGVCDATVSGFTGCVLFIVRESSACG